MTRIDTKGAKVVESKTKQAIAVSTGSVSWCDLLHCKVRGNALFLVKFSHYCSSSVYQGVERNTACVP